MKRVLPAEWLRRNQRGLRRLVALAYVGNRYACNLCKFRMARFVELDNGDRLCPRCGSLPRTRRLYQLLDEFLDRPQLRVLHFSPPPPLAERLRSRLGDNYVTTDFAGEFSADRALDITRMEVADAAFDLIICYHVLEHIVADRQAMTELHRVLAPGGHCLVQTPFRSGATYEDDSIVSEEDRLRHFGQRDHVRVYAAAGLADRLEGAGFAVEVRAFREERENSLGLKGEEVVLVVKCI